MNLFKSDHRILAGAEELFIRYGIKSVTMDDLARHLGMSKKTIYSEFPDKNTIVVQLVGSSVREHFHQMEAMADTARDSVEEIMLMMRYTNEIFGSVNPNVFYDMQRHHPEAWQTFRRFKDEFILNQITRNLENGRNQGLYRSDFNIRIIAQLRLEQVESVLNPLHFPPEKFNLKDVNFQLLEHFLFGICTLKGHKLILKYKQNLFKDVH